MSIITVITVLLFPSSLLHTKLSLSSHCTNPSPVMHVFLVWVYVRERECVCECVCDEMSVVLCICKCSGL